MSADVRLNEDVGQFAVYSGGKEEACQLTYLRLQDFRVLSNGDGM
jgi:hypothetical protein